MYHDRSSKRRSAPRLPASLGAPRDHLYPRFSEADIGKTLRFGTLIIAIGDARAASAKRVAAAVDDGAAVVSEIHQFPSSVSPTA